MGIFQHVIGIPVLLVNISYRQNYWKAKEFNIFYKYVINNNDNERANLYFNEKCLSVPPMLKGVFYNLRHIRSFELWLDDIENVLYWFYYPFLELSTRLIMIFLLIILSYFGFP